MTTRKPYNTPVFCQRISVPITPCAFNTIYEFKAELAEWYLPDLVALQALLCIAWRAKVNVGVLLLHVESCIDKALLILKGD